VQSRSTAVVSLFLIVSGTGVSGQTPLRHYAVDAASSVIYVVTHKEGLLSFLGHKHAILPTVWEGSLCLAGSFPGGSRGTLVIQTASLVIDSDSARALAGLGGGPDEDTIRELQRKITDADHLAADTYPEVRVEVLETQAEDGASGGSTAQTRATVTLHGVTRVMDLPVTLEPMDQGGFRVKGVLTLRQSDFGIRPESIAGVVKVSDPVDLHFLLVALPTGDTCEGGASAPRRAREGPPGLMKDGGRPGRH
jgi:hypothetical protein